MSDGKLRWTNEVGAATIANLLTFFAMVIGGVFMFAKMDATATNTADTTKTLQHIIERQETRTGAMNDRLTVTETKVTAIADTVKTINDKIDRIATRP